MPGLGSCLQWAVSGPAPLRPNVRAHTMSRFLIPFSLAMLTVGCCVFAQTTNRDKITASEAVRIVKAHVAIGMRHQEVRKILEEQGFAKISPAHIRMHSCILQQDQLANDYALKLEYMPTMRHTNDDWMLELRTSRLVQASK